MSVASIYLPPALAMVMLSYLVALTVLMTRSLDLASRRKSVAYYEDFEGVGASVAVMRTTRQLANLFEFPVLFYFAIALLVALGLQDRMLPWLCWLYVGLRWSHAASHLLFNKLWLRTPVFIAGQLTLLSIWLRMCVLALAGGVTH